MMRSIEKMEETGGELMEVFTPPPIHLLIRQPISTIGNYTFLFGAENTFYTNKSRI